MATSKSTRATLYHLVMAKSRDTSAAGSELGFSALVFSDLLVYRPNVKPSWVKVLARCSSNPGLIASVILRAQQCAFRSGHVRTAQLLRTVGVLTVGADFTPGMTIGTGLYMPHPVGITMGNGTVIGNDVILAHGVTIGARVEDGGEHSWPTICDGALLFSHAVVVGAVRVGVRAQVGANSLVVNDVPDHAVVLGVPARRVGTREGGPERQAV